MTLSLPIFIKLIINNTFCKEIHIENYENPMSGFVDVTRTQMDGQTNRQTWY